MSAVPIISTYKQRAQPAICCLGLFHLLERIALTAPSSGRHPAVELKATFGGNWDTLLKDRELSEGYRYIVPPGHPQHRDLTYRGAGGPHSPGHLLKVSRLIHDVSRKYIASGSAIETQQDDAGIRPIFEFLKEIDDKWFLREIQATEADAGITRGEQGDRSSLLASRFLERLKSSSRIGDLKDPDFSQLSLFSYLAVGSAFHGMTNPDKQTPTEGLFAMIRESRGLVTESGHEQDRNTVVRDLLWMSGNGNGFYFSAHDRICYEVTTETGSGNIEDSNLIITGRADGSDRSKHNFHMILPKPSMNIPVMDAILAGTGKSHGDLAAWKVLVLRPSEKIWPIAKRLDTILSISNDIVPNSLDRHFSPDQLFSIVESSGACVKLSGCGDDRAFRLRETFRRMMVASTTVEEPAPLGNNLRNALRSIIEDKVRARHETLNRVDLIAAAIKEDLRDYLIELLIDCVNDFVERNWHLIEPAQIVSFIKKHVDVRRDKLGEEHDTMISSLLEIIVDHSGDSHSIRSDSKAPPIDV